MVIDYHTMDDFLLVFHCNCASSLHRFQDIAYLGRSANLPTGLYILPSEISFYPNISASTGPIFTIFSPYKRNLREFSRSGSLFFRFLKGLCHGNRFGAKFAK